MEYTSYIENKMTELKDRLSESGNLNSFEYRYDKDVTCEIDKMEINELLDFLESDDAKKAQVYITYNKNVFYGDLLENYINVSFGDTDFLVDRLYELIMSLSSKKELLKRITIKLINAKRHPEIGKLMPVKTFFELSIVYMINIYHDDNEIDDKVLILTNQMLKNIDEKITDEELFQAAQENTERLFPGTLTSGESELDDIFDFNEIINTHPIFVVKSKKPTLRIPEATILLYKDFLKNAANMMGSDIVFITPHESTCLIIPIDRENTIAFTTRFVEILKTVLGSELFAEGTYIYHRDTGEIEMKSLNDDEIYLDNWKL